VYTSNTTTTTINPQWIHVIDADMPGNVTCSLA
jgi:hypothetical protein